MERDTARYVAYNNTTDATGNYVRSVRNKLKGAARKVFIEKAMRSNKLREVWKVPRILKPSPNPLRFDPDELNEHFSSISQKTLDSAVTYPTLNWLIWLIVSLSVPWVPETFHARFPVSVKSRADKGLSALVKS